MSNDRFKFRVWDGQNYVDNFMPLVINRKGSLICSLNGDVMNTNVFRVEQCTGLKDKNGKLIYDGDVVSFDGVKMFVEWSEKSCRWVLRYADKKHHLYWETMSLCPPAEDYYPNEYRIIGNIHERF